MKKILVTICLLCTLLATSSCRGPEAPEPVYAVWDGSVGDILGTPVYAQLGERCGPSPCWRPAKYVADSNGLHLLIDQLAYPEVEKNYFGGRYILVIFYFAGYHELPCYGCGLRVREVPCDIEGDTFIGPRGESKALGRLLNEAAECKPYWQYQLPDPNAVKRMQEELYEAARERSIQLRNDPNWRKAVEEHFQQPADK